MISLEHINAAYQTKTGTLPVLSNIDIQVPEGETCALIGPSGCGKSTLLKIAAGECLFSRGTTGSGQACHWFYAAKLRTLALAAGEG